MNDRITSPIVGLGLSRTGTTSLGEALRILGIPTVHYPHDEELYDELTSGTYQLSILNHFQAIVDISVAPFYPQLDRVYSESKFILTVRDQEEWLHSLERHWPRMQARMEQDEQFERFTRFICACVYGSWEFSADRFKYVYERHVANVQGYFEGRSDDLLILDICGGDGWEPLCSFFDLPVPSRSFPHANRFASRGKKSDWQRRVHRVQEEIAQVCDPDDPFILIDEEEIRPRLEGTHEVIPFLEQDGRYWGPPPDDREAIQELNRLRRAGVRNVVVAWPAFWWLDYYDEFGRFLRDEGRIVREHEDLVVFNLRGAV